MQTITDICNIPASAVSQMLMQPATLNEKNFHPSGSQNKGDVIFPPSQSSENEEYRHFAGKKH